MAANGFKLIKENNKMYYGHETKLIYPIHSVNESLKQQLKLITHHYCGLFTKDVLTTLPDRIQVSGTEYQVDKHNRLLITSYDGHINLWQCSPTFTSQIHYKSGTPILDSSGNIVSIITGSKNGRYAISCFDGISGKFETNREWSVIKGINAINYGNQTFQTRDELKEYLQGKKMEAVDLQAILIDTKIPRIALVDLKSGLEMSHCYIRGNFTVEICDNYH